MAAVASKTDTTVEKNTLPLAPFAGVVLAAFACDILAALGYCGTLAGKKSTAIQKISLI